MEEKKNIWEVYTLNIDKLTREFASEKSKRHTGNGLVLRRSEIEIIEEKIKFLCDLIVETKFEDRDRIEFDEINRLCKILSSPKIKSRITEELYKNHIFPTIDKIRMEIISFVLSDRHIYRL